MKHGNGIVAWGLVIAVVAGCGGGELAPEDAAEGERVMAVPDSTIEREIATRLDADPRLDAEGIRLGASWDPDERVPHHRTKPGPGLLRRDDFRAGFAQLAPRGLPGETDVTIAAPIVRLVMRPTATVDAEATAAAMGVLDVSHLLRRTIAARRPAVPQRLRQWSREEAAPVEQESWMSTFDISRDVRYALRLMLRAPAFSVIAITTFALGIGINTAVFNVVNGVLLRPLPYPDADRITMLWVDNRRQGIREDITSYPAYLDWKTQSTSYDHMAGFTEAAFSLTGSGEPERLIGAQAAASFFDVMGIPPAIGRVFTVENETPGRDSVVVLSYGLWQRRFGGASDALGRTITLNGRPREVIGVMPESFRFTHGSHAVWTPIQFNELDGERSAHSFFAAARIKDGVSFETAEAEIRAIGQQLAGMHPQNRGEGATITRMDALGVEPLHPTLVALTATVALVLLIACVNVANLMLAQAASRRREFAICAALGAGRGRLAMQLLAEGLLLAVAGGAAGVLLASLGTTALAESLPPAIRFAPFRNAGTVPVDGRVLGFTSAIALVTGILFSLAPMFGAAYRASGRGTRIMDGLAIHPYGDSSSQAPRNSAHPNSTYIGLADYDKLNALLVEAFGKELPAAVKGKRFAFLVINDDWGRTMVSSYPPSIQKAGFSLSLPRSELVTVRTHISRPPYDLPSVASFARRGNACASSLKIHVRPVGQTRFRALPRGFGSLDIDVFRTFGQTRQEGRHLARELCSRCFAIRLQQQMKIAACQRGLRAPVGQVPAVPGDEGDAAVLALHPRRLVPRELGHGVLRQLI